MSNARSPLETTYIIWTCIGAFGAFAVGILVFREAMAAMRLIAAALVVGNLVFMKPSSTA